MIPFWHLLFRARSTRPLPRRFLAVADAVSAGMGSPINILAWALAVVLWTGAFIVYPGLQDTTFLPAWFTSNAYNFPLNTVTTLAELFIGFLIAAAANRVERRNWELHQAMATMLKHVEGLAETEEGEIRAEEGELVAMRADIAAIKAFLVMEK